MHLSLAMHYCLCPLPTKALPLGSMQVNGHCFNIDYRNGQGIVPLGLKNVIIDDS